MFSQRVFLPAEVYKMEPMEDVRSSTTEVQSLPDSRLALLEPAPAEPPLGPERTLSPEPPKNLAKNNDAQPEQPKIHVHVHTPRGKWGEPLNISTLILACVTLVFVVLTHYDAEQAVETAKATTAKIVSAQQLVNQQSIVAQKAVNDEIVKTQRDTTKESIRASAKQSHDALNMAAAVAAWDQRPWLSVSSYNFPDVTEGQGFQVKLLLQNTGKTAAINQVTKTTVYVSSTDPAPDFSKLLTPVGPFNITAASNNSWVFTGPCVLSAALMKDYTARTSFIYVLAELRYGDMFGRNYLTTLCIGHKYGRPSDEVFYCPGNKME